MINNDVKISKLLKPLAKDIDACLTDEVGERVGFSLIIYPLKSTDRAQYISNCQRDTSADALQEVLTRWRQEMPNIPAHKVQ